MTPGRRLRVLRQTSLLWKLLPSTSVVLDSQQRRQWLACQFFDIVLRWFMRSSSMTTTFLPQFPVVWFSAACHVDDRHGRTTNHSLLESAVRGYTRVPTSWNNSLYFPTPWSRLKSRPFVKLPNMAIAVTCTTMRRPGLALRQRNIAFVGWQVKLCDPVTCDFFPEVLRLLWTYVRNGINSA